MNPKAIFRDGINRVMARKKDRDKAVSGIFENILASLGLTGEFAGEYLAAMSIRSKSWDTMDAEALLQFEVARAIEAAERTT